MPDDETLPLWDPFLQQSGLGSVTGTSDCGKSAFCRQFCIAIATNQTEFLNHKLNPKHHRVYFVSSEDDIQATSTLLKKQLKGQNFPDDYYRNLCFVFDCENLASNLDKLLTRRPACLVVMDSFGDFLEGKDINGNAHVRALLNQYSKLAKKHSCFFLFIHHVGKRTEGNGPSKHNAIGSQAFEAKMRIVLELSTDDDERKHMCVVKGNYLSKEYKKASYVMEFEEDTLSFSMTDERVDFSELSRQEGKEKYDVDWFAVFDGAVDLQLKEICKRLNERYDMPEGTAKTYIKKYLVKGSKFGYYRIPNTDVKSQENP